ncbi:GNAT family N-acetyltransferase [Streptomyces uncialis]|uniref:GNAT family N-acetyltransferase n=1 Tax=Streptomyces uncialis TaxID=1048205 RepID=UPI0037AEEAA8
MDLRRHTHADAQHVRSLLLDLHDAAYVDNPDPFHSRERFSCFLDLWSSRENWQCVSGWEASGPVGYAYDSMLKPGGWWKGHARPLGLRGPVFALSELMVVPEWRGTGRARQLHEALLAPVPARVVTLLVETGKPRVQALYESWGYDKAGETSTCDDSPTSSVMVRKP